LQRAVLDQWRGAEQISRNLLADADFIFGAGFAKKIDGGLLLLRAGSGPAGLLGWRALTVSVVCLGGFCPMASSTFPKSKPPLLAVENAPSAIASRNACFFI
jgi:hypothetical protein